MLKPFDPFDEIVPPECRATVDRVQLALDGDASPDAFDADPHLGACSTCRERVRAARVLLTVLATPVEPVPEPVGFTDRVLSAMWEDRHTQTRRGVYKAAAWLALAAAVLIGAFAIFGGSDPQKPLVWLPPVETAKPAEVAPAPREKAPPAPAPEPRRSASTTSSRKPGRRSATPRTRSRIPSRSHRNCSTR